MNEEKTSFVEIKKIGIKVGDRNITMSPDEGKELKLALDEMFEKSKVETRPIKEGTAGFDRNQKPHPSWYYYGTSSKDFTVGKTSDLGTIPGALLNNVLYNSNNVMLSVN